MCTKEIRTGVCGTTTQVRGKRLNANFFSQTFRQSPGYPGKCPGISRPKVWFRLVSRDIPNFWAPPPHARGRQKIILTTPTPHISKKYAPKICHGMRGRMALKSLELKGLSQRMWCTNRLLWHTNSDFYGIRPPTFVPYEPCLLGVGGGLQFVERPPPHRKMFWTQKSGFVPLFLACKVRIEY